MESNSKVKKKLRIHLEQIPTIKSRVRVHLPEPHNKTATLKKKKKSHLMNNGAKWLILSD